MILNTIAKKNEDGSLERGFMCGIYFTINVKGRRALSLTAKSVPVIATSLALNLGQEKLLETGQRIKTTFNERGCIISYKTAGRELYTDLQVSSSELEPLKKCMHAMTIVQEHVQNSKDANQDESIDDLIVALLNRVRSSLFFENENPTESTINHLTGPDHRERFEYILMNTLGYKVTPKELIEMWRERENNSAVKHLSVLVEPFALDDIFMLK